MKTLPLLLLVMALPLTAQETPGEAARGDDLPSVAQGDAPDVVQFRFQWPASLAARVESSRREARTGANARDNSLAIRYRLQALPQDGQLRIHAAQVEPVSRNGRALSAEDRTPDFDVMTATLLPDYLVTPEGDFAGLHDLPGMQARLRAVLAGILPEDAPAEARQALARMQETLLAEPTLSMPVATQWSALVAAWVGADLEVGETYELQTEEPIELLPGATARTNIEFRVLRRLPCARGGQPRQCVEVSLLSAVAPEDALRLAQQMLQQIGAPVDTAELDGARLTRVFQARLTTEPDGLIPHAYTSRELTTISTGAGDAVSAQSNEKEERFRFFYD